jgi:regulator of protease activity HflC (stomatin/prohibitin superfamily)
MTANQGASNRERTVTVLNGWFMLVLLAGLLLADVALLVTAARQAAENGPGMVLACALALPLIVLLTTGFFTLQPNEARVLILFGDYKGTVRESGFHWGNPFYTSGPQNFRMAAAAAAMQGKRTSSKSEPDQSQPRALGRNKISLRARTLNGDTLKVNDKRGNPIEIAVVVVWRVADTAQAMFDVDNYETYMRTQSESAVRHLASLYFYDDGEEGEATLRGHVDDVSRALRAELQERLIRAGIAVDEARLTHLAYAPEIAQAMLRRQQAEAVIAARQKIVHGAVSMVHMALTELAEKQVVQLDDERRAAMVSNLMVVLCGESEVHPVVNTGTLYN